MYFLGPNSATRFLLDNNQFSEIDENGFGGAKGWQKEVNKNEM